MQEGAIILDWLAHLREIVPPNGVLYVGAGTGTGAWIDGFRRWGVANVTLIEANAQSVRQLRSVENAGEGWRVVEQVISPEPGEVDFWQMDDDHEHGLLGPDLLRDLWPDVYATGREESLGVPICGVPSATNAFPSWLVVDCFPSLEILRGAANNLASVDVVVARAVTGTDLPRELGHREALCTQMREAGMRLVAWEAQRHPAVGHGLFVRDFEALARRRAELEDRVRSLEGELAERKLQASTARRPPVEDVANVVVQLEAHMNLQRLMDGKPILPDLHGWPISPDFGLHLVRLVTDGNFRLIVEFGSGVSTLLLAQALTRRAEQTGNAPARHVAFEHLEEFAVQTELILRRWGLGDAATSVAIAPLVPFSDETGEYSFYDADAVLAELADTEQSGSVLVVVDGPPGATCRNARYPALPAVMKALGSREICVLLDDHERDEERGVGNAWLQMLRREGREVDVRVLRFEKGALELRIRGVDGADAPAGSAGQEE